MNLYSRFVWLPEDSILLFLIELAAKGILILAAVTLAAWALRGASAASRNMVWVGGLFALLILPFSISLMPGWGVPVLSSESAPDVLSYETPLEFASDSRGSGLTSAEEPDAAPAFSGNADIVRESRGSVVPLAGLMIWLGGAFLATLPLAYSFFRLRRLARRATAFDSPEWRTLLDECCAQMGLKRNVRLREGPSGLMPMTWGIRRPVILLPGEAHSWSASLRRSVLLHELAI